MHVNIKRFAPPPPFFTYSKHPFFQVWQDAEDEILAESRRYKYHLPAPKMPLPGHAESYNPPAEYLLSQEEQKQMEEMDPTDRFIALFVVVITVMNKFTTSIILKITMINKIYLFYIYLLDHTTSFQTNQTVFVVFLDTITSSKSDLSGAWICIYVPENLKNG